MVEALHTSSQPRLASKLHTCSTSASSNAESTVGFQDQQCTRPMIWSSEDYLEQEEPWPLSTITLCGPNGASEMSPSGSTPMPATLCEDRSVSVPLLGGYRNWLFRLLLLKELTRRAQLFTTKYAV